MRLVQKKTTAYVLSIDEEKKEVVYEYWVDNELIQSSYIGESSIIEQLITGQEIEIVYKMKDIQETRLVKEQNTILGTSITLLTLSTFFVLKIVLISRKARKDRKHVYTKYDELTTMGL